MKLKERIIETAMKMFSEEGIKSVRMDDIASQCGISKRTLYEIFADRDDLIRQSLDYYISYYEKLIDRQLAQADNILHEFWIIFGRGAQVRHSYRIVMRDLFKFYPHIFNEFMNSHHCDVLEKNAERIRIGQANNLILKDIDADFMSKILTSYLYGIKREFEGMDFEEWGKREVSAGNLKQSHPFQFVIMLYFRGMATEKGREYIDNVILGGIK